MIFWIIAIVLLVGILIRVALLARSVDSIKDDLKRISDKLDQES